MKNLQIASLLAASTFAGTFYIDYTIRDAIVYQVIPQGGKISKHYWVDGREPIVTNDNDSVRISFTTLCSYADSVWIDGKLLSDTSIRRYPTDNFYVDFPASNSSHIIKLSPYLPTQLKPTYKTTWIAGPGGVFSTMPNKHATMEKTWECPGYFGEDWLTYPIYVKPDSGYLLKSLHIDDSALAIIPQGEMYDPNKYHYHANRGGTIRAEFEPASVYNLDVDFNSEGGVVVVNKISKLDSSAKLRMPATQASVGFLPRRGYYIDTILLNGVDTIGTSGYVWNAISGNYLDTIRTRMLNWQNYDRNNKVHVHFAKYPEPAKTAIVLHLNDSNTRILKGKTDPKTYGEGDTLWLEPGEKATLYAGNPHKDIDFAYGINYTTLGDPMLGLKITDSIASSEGKFISAYNWQDFFNLGNIRYQNVYTFDNSIAPARISAPPYFRDLSSGPQLWHTPRLMLNDTSTISVRFDSSPSSHLLEISQTAGSKGFIISTSKDTSLPCLWGTSGIIDLSNPKIDSVYAKLKSNNPLLIIGEYNVYSKDGHFYLVRGYRLGRSAPPAHDSIFVSGEIPLPTFHYSLTIDSSIHGAIDIDTSDSTHFNDPLDTTYAQWKSLPTLLQSRHQSYGPNSENLLRFAAKINPDLDYEFGQIHFLDQDNNSTEKQFKSRIDKTTSDSIYGLIPALMAHGRKSTDSTAHFRFSFYRNYWNWNIHSSDSKCIQPTQGRGRWPDTLKFDTDSGYLAWIIRINGQQTFFDRGLRQVRLPLTLSDSVGYFDIEVECVSSHPESLVWQDPVVNTPVISNPRVHWKLRNREISGLNPAQTVEIYDAAGTLLRTGNADATGKFNLPSTLGGRIIVKVGSTVLNTIIP